MITGDNDAMIVRSTIDLAHTPGIKGIENKGASELLTIRGCDLGQGYYFSCPISDVKFEKWIVSRNKDK